MSTAPPSFPPSPHIPATVNHLPEADIDRLSYLQMHTVPTTWSASHALSS